jgi:DtxR family Mn-dependent transcriptional regulator
MGRHDPKDAAVPPLSETIEDYLKAVLSLGEGGQRVSTSALAGRLGVKPPSVTAMLKRLGGEEPRLLDYRSHQGVRLTRTGERIALAVTRRHRLIEQFLVTTLGYGWDEVHDEAHRLEHCVSEAFVDRIDRLLGHPAIDPHGRPIPRRDGAVARLREFPLTEAGTGENVCVSSVRSEEVAFLRHLSSLGIGLGTPVSVVDVSPLGDVVTIEIGPRDGGGLRVIGASVAREVFVSRGAWIDGAA